MKIKELILKNLMLFPGWRTKRKIVVIDLTIGELLELQINKNWI